MYLQNYRKRTEIKPKYGVVYFGMDFSFYPVMLRAVAT